MRVVTHSAILAVLMALAAACGGGSRPENEQTPSTSARSDGTPVAMDKSAYPVLPNADSGADPSVPAEQGGRGFTGQGWQTSTDFDLIGDPRAVKGGVFREAMPDFPATLRYIGPNLSVWNAMLHGMVYETLLGLHPVTLEYIPVVATHWQISPDQLTYRFRLDPNARFSDGSPVTSDDVIASWKLMVDKTVQDPFRNALFGGFDQPIAESRYIVRVKAKEAGWTALYYFSGLPLYPAQALEGLDGARYIREYNDKMLPGTGPYIVTAQDVDKGRSVRIRRRADYWAASYRRNIGSGNFDEIREVVVRDRNLEFEMLKRGDLDFYHVNRAQMWVEELNFDKIQNGQLQKRKVWNHSPNSIQGIAFNTRRAPYDDERVRKAIRHLYNRELMIAKLTFNESLPMDSMYPGTIYENAANEKIRFDPQAAVGLLAEAGWKDRNAQGQIVKNGAPLAVEILYYDRASERFLTIFQEDLRKVGVTLNLRYVTPETAFKLLDEQQFGMFSVAYGGGGPFPLPEQFFHSAQADQKASTNVSGFKNPKVDQIIEAYDREFDVKKRAALLREIDGIVSASHHYLLEWYAPFQRVVYWNKFGYPKGVFTRIGDYRDAVSLWWLDPSKDQPLQEALRDPSRKLEAGAADDRYWLEFAKVEEQQNPTAAR